MTLQVSRDHKGIPLLRIRPLNSSFGDPGFELLASGLGFRVWGLGFRGLGFRGFGVAGLGISGVDFRA